MQPVAPNKAINVVKIRQTRFLQKMIGDFNKTEKFKEAIYIKIS
jgi:hypothetical protein